MSESPAVVPEKLKELLEEFHGFNRDTKAQVLIEYAEQFKEVPQDVASRPFSEQSKIPACESEAYIFAEPTSDQSIRFHFAVENPQGISAMAMAVIIDETLSGQSKERILAVSDDIVFDIFGREISMGKGLGLRNMVQAVKALTRSSL